MKALNVSRECLLEENGITVAMQEQLVWLDEKIPGIIKLTETFESPPTATHIQLFPAV